MMEDFKKILLAGIGSAAYTYEKASNLVDDMVKKGKLSVDEGKELSQELKRNFKDTQDKFNEKVVPLSKEDVLSIIEDMNLANQNEVNDLKEKILELERKIDALESK